MSAAVRTDEDYVRFDPFDGERDVDIKLRIVNLVTTRKPHQCMSPTGNKHEIPAGTRVRYERALVDSDYWGRYYVCIPCMDKWFAEMAA